MARVRPFKAFTYTRSTADITSLVAPPYDVIGEKERARLLARSAHNIVALELPEGPLDPAAPGNRYETGRKRWREWRDSGVVVRDRMPTIYVLEQRYELEGAEIRRRAFIGEVALHTFEEGVVLPHERTLPKALGDRFNLTKACAANFSQVFGLFSDPAQSTARIFTEATRGPVTLSATDADGVTSDVWALTDRELIANLATILEHKQVFIADGHHRYTTALAYRDERRSQDASAGLTPANPAYDYVMMALVNMDDPGLVILPTHRVARVAGEFDPGAFRAALTDSFDLTEVSRETAREALDTASRPGFVVATGDGTQPLLATVRDEIDLETAIGLDRSRAWKELDVAVLQELVLDPLLGIHPDRPESLDRLSFIKDADEAFASTTAHDIAFILRATRIDQMRAVALSGETMPQKSTYFYPKLLSGLVMRAMD